MGHNRKLIVGGASLTTARLNRHTVAAAGEVNDELEHIMIATSFLDTAPFKWVGLILRFGLKNENEPHFRRINSKYGDLPVAIELDTRELRGASREELKEIFMIATLKTLVHIGKKYELSHEQFEQMLREAQASRTNRVAPKGSQP